MQVRRSPTDVSKGVRNHQRGDWVQVRRSHGLRLGWQLWEQRPHPRLWLRAPEFVSWDSASLGQG